MQQKLVNERIIKDVPMTPLAKRPSGLLVVGRVGKKRPRLPSVKDTLGLSPFPRGFMLKLILKTKGFSGHRHHARLVLNRSLINNCVVKPTLLCHNRS